MEGANGAPKVRRIVEIEFDEGPVNAGDSPHHASIAAGTMDREKALEYQEDTRGFICCFDDREKVKHVLERLKEEELGISIVVSGVLDEVKALARETGLKPHTINLSLGIWGKTELLPGPEVLEFSTMCGHGLVPTALFERAQADIASGRCTRRRSCPDGWKALHMRDCQPHQGRPPVASGSRPSRVDWGQNVKLDFTSVPVIDNHCHPLSSAKAILDSEHLAREFFHGMGDIPEPGVKKPRLWGATDGLSYHFPNMGVVQTMVCQLARVLDCPPELEAVTAARNRCTAEDFGGYARMLYEDAGIVGTVVDSDLPADDPGLRLIPGRVLRLFQMSPAIKKLLPAAGSFGELRNAYQESLDRAVRQDGFVGVKSHLAEEAGFGAPFCPDAEAESVFGAAQAGEGAAYKRLYVAIFQATLLQAQDLDIPVHLHSGITGGFWNGPIADADPFLLMPLLRRHEFLASRVVLLHGAYPWMQHAAMMAHALPHLWVDVGWTISLGLAAHRRVLPRSDRARPAVQADDRQRLPRHARDFLAGRNHGQDCPGQSIGRCSRARSDGERPGRQCRPFDSAR